MPQTNLTKLPKNFDFALCSTTYSCLEISKDEYKSSKEISNYDQLLKLNAVVKALEDIDYNIDRKYTSVINSYVIEDKNLLNIISYLNKNNTKDNLIYDRTENKDFISNLSFAILNNDQLDIPKLNEEELKTIINSYNKQISLEYKDKKNKNKEEVR